MVFESTSMRYETLVARFWLRVRGVPQSSSRRLSCAKEKSSGVENDLRSENSKQFVLLETTNETARLIHKQIISYNKKS